VSGIAPSMLDRLMAYSWPGNARELRNTIERAVILCPDGSPLDAGHLPQGFGDCGRGRAAADPAHSGGHRAKQDARGGDPWREPEDSA
jgi:transcriptional regulator with PAS, ATPase and Fis domain